MADDKKNEQKAPLSVKKPELAGEDDQTVKIKKPVIPTQKPVVDVGGKADDADNEGNEEKTATIPKIPKPGEKKAPVLSVKPSTDEEDTEATIAMDKDEVVPINKSGEDDQTAKIPKIPKPGEKDKKIVLNSATESTIRPSDATTMAPAVVPEKIDMRTTESGNVEVVDDAKKTPEPAVANNPAAPPKPAAPTTPPKPAAPAAATPADESKGRKTIKLKPLKKDTTAEEEKAEETISMDRSKLAEDNKMPPLAVSKPADEGGADDESNLEDEATVKIQKPAMSKPAHPTPVVPGAKETIKLRPSTTPPPPGSAPSGITKTEPAAGDDPGATGKKTIRLVAKKPGEDDGTQKTPKPSAPTAAAPAAPPAAGGAPGTAKPSAPTVKLSEGSAQKSAKPSAPTVKLPDESASGGASKKTLKLKPTSPAAPPPQAASEPGGGGMPPASAPPAGGPSEGPTGKIAGAKPKAKGSDPGIVLTLVAVLAFMLMAYYVWMVAGQWAEQYQEVESANVPALSGKTPNPR